MTDSPTREFERLDYDKETGVFTWNVSFGRVKAGAAAGCRSSDGYLKIRYEGKEYKHHRLVWFFTYGAWPREEIDHINGDKLDNRISNLRDVSRNVNQQNMRKPCNKNKSGFLGVYWNKRNNRWDAKIRIHGKSVHLGSFMTAEEAHKVYVDVKRMHHEGCTI